MSLEVERKFLLDELPPWLADCGSAAIRQGYLALDGETEVRVREHGAERTLTVKRGGGLVRVEVEVELDAARFEALWPLTDGRRVVKRRHLVPAGEVTFEVDVYGEGLAGLRVAEVEFASVEASAAFEPPPWLGAEVTDDGRYKNRSLAVNGAPGLA